MTRTNFRQTIGVAMKCKECSRIQTIRRKKCRKKKRGHIKPLHCTNCGKRTFHVELGME